VKTFFDRGKYHLRFDHQTRLGKTTLIDQHGKESPPKLVESKPTRYAIIHDGKAEYALENDEEPRRDAAGAGRSGMWWRAVAGLGRNAIRVDQVIRNLGGGAVTVVALPGGGVRGTCVARPAGQYRVEFDALPEAGYNVVAYRVINRGDQVPTQACRITWEKCGGRWYARKIVQEFDGRHRAKDPFGYQRAVFEFDRYEPGAKVNSNLFRLDHPDGW
jgi:hypothetical protein